MSSTEPSQLDRIETKVDQILAAVTGPPPEPEPGVLAPPSNFNAVLNADRSITCTWTDAPDAEAVEVHEFLADPDTLAETVPAGVQTRTSGVLTGGHDYEYAVRSVLGAEVSAFTTSVTIYVPAEGEEPTDPTDPTDPPATGTDPSDVLDLTNWTVMLPVGSDGDPDNDYAADWGTIPDIFFVSSNGGVVFRCPAGGVHSPNSEYPRTEAREMVDTNWTKAAWSSDDPHSLECDLAIDASGLSNRKRINAMQIHDGGDDVCQLMRHESNGLGLMHDDGNSWESIDPGYVDGTRFTCKIEVTGSGRILVYYNGALVVDIPKSGSSWYWKFGCYLQTNEDSWGEDPEATGEVTVWSYTKTG